MTFTYERSDTNRDKVRLLISDIDANNAIFQDEEINNFLSLKGGDVFAGAALALRTIAANYVMTLKVITLLELSIDAASMASELREQANKLDEQAATSGSMTVVNFADTVFNRRQRFINRAKTS